MLVQTIASVSRRRPILWAGEVAVNYLTGIGLAQLHGILYSEILKPQCWPEYNSNTEDGGDISAVSEWLQESEESQNQETV